MDPVAAERAVAAAKSEAAALGLHVEDAVVLHRSNRIAVRLTPCETLARVAVAASPVPHGQLELDVARRLAEAGSPAAEPDPRVEPRVHLRDGFAITLWTYYPPVTPSSVMPVEYAQVLALLHAGLRQVDLVTPHVADRVAEAARYVADEAETPDLPPSDRALLADALRGLGAEIGAGGAGEQLLHGEPHVGNVLRTHRGLLLIDFETCCRGPVEFDIAHGLLPNEDGERLPLDDVCRHYPEAAPEVVERCCALIWAMITTWRWQRDDRLPNGQHWRIEGLRRLRAALDA